MRWWPRRRVYLDDLPRTHDARFLLIFLMVLVATFGGVYAVGYLAAGDKVPARTTVAGVEIGSLSRHEARDVLVQAFASRLREPLTVTAAGRRLKLIPRDEGVSFDVEATLDRAMGGTDWDPHHMLKVIEGGGAVDPIFRADPTVLATALEPLAARVERAPVSTTVATNGGKPLITPGHAGRRLDVPSAADTVAAALLDHRSSARLRLAPVEPPVDLATATSFVHGQLKPALSRPAVVSVGGAELRVQPDRFGPALRVTQSGGRLRLSILPGVLYRHTRALLSTVPGRPVDARVVFHHGHPVVLPGRSGSEVDQAGWAKAVFAAATQSETHHAKAAVTVVQPNLTTADARALSITNQISTVTGTAKARTAGALSLAARNLDATVVLPGETFSYNRTVGRASAHTVLSPLGAATQTAAERADMAITQWPQVSPVGHNLAFRNTTEHPVYIRSLVKPQAPGRSAVVVQFWGTPTP